MEEIWKEYIYNYSISNLGKIKNNKTDKILKQTYNASGYLQCNVCLGNRKNKMTIRMNRAVAKLFISNPENKPQVNHKDGDKQNNKVDNLEWCTNSENQIHAFKIGLNKGKKGEDNNCSKLSNIQVYWIRNNYKPRDKEFGCRALAKKFNVNHSNISKIINYKKYN